MRPLYPVIYRQTVGAWRSWWEILYVIETVTDSRRKGRRGGPSPITRASEQLRACGSWAEARSLKDAA